MRLFGLIGYPLEHSFSKGYFSKKFEREGLLHCRFENFPIASINQLKEQVLDKHTDLNGLAVTIPYKQEVRQYLHSDENIPAALNACNCIKISGGNLIGYNTDYIGFEKSFTPLLKPHHNRALVLGNGGSAAAVTYVLNKLQISYDIVSRTLHGNSTLTYQDIDAAILQSSTVIINTTPVGMFPDIAGLPDLPYKYLTPDHYLFDLIYNPAKTKFLGMGEDQGAQIKNGADMLVYQAEENWRIWNEL